MAWLGGQSGPRVGRGAEDELAWGAGSWDVAGSVRLGRRWRRAALGECRPRGFSWLLPGPRGFECVRSVGFILF